MLQIKTLFMIPVLVVAALITDPKITPPADPIQDEVIDRYIKTVRLYPALGSAQDEFLPPVIPVSQPSPLVLEFDDLNEDYVSFAARIIHCDRDWKVSQLRDNEFLFEYNLFRVRDYSFSLDTRVPYVHYRFIVPRVKLPGNYVIEVFPDGYEEEVIFRKRFMVFDNQVMLESEESLTRGMVEYAQRNQQINFTLNYRKTQIINPMESVKVKILQNHRWDKAIEGLQPSFVREDLKELEYRHFSDENLMTAGNEFRFFDMRSIRYPGQNVDIARMYNDHVTAYLTVDRSRKGLAYTFNRDYNGQFLVRNQDEPDPALSSEYAQVNFTLESPEVNGDVYIFGALTNWQLEQDYRMTYDEAAGRYRGSVLLKQGWYDYMYYVDHSDLPVNYFEGNHFETENYYEIMVYYRPMDLRADLLIGYYVLTRN